MDFLALAGWLSFGTFAITAFAIARKVAMKSDVLSPEEVRSLVHKEVPVIYFRSTLDGIKDDIADIKTDVAVLAAQYKERQWRKPRD